MSKKYFLILVGVFMLGAQAHADKLDRNGILRKDDGSIHLMTYDDALQACPSGTHLPPLRELAKFSQEHGAKGILELNEIKNDVVPNGYELFEAYDSDVPVDRFYFNFNGYKNVASIITGFDLMRSEFSSFHPTCPEDGCPVDSAKGTPVKIDMQEGPHILTVRVDLRNYEALDSSAAYKVIKSAVLTISKDTWQSALTDGTINQEQCAHAHGLARLDTDQGSVTLPMECDLYDGSNAQALGLGDQDRFFVCSLTAQKGKDNPGFSFGFIRN